MPYVSIGIKGWGLKKESECAVRTRFVGVISEAVSC